MSTGPKPQYPKKLESLEKKIDELIRINSSTTTPSPEKEKIYIFKRKDFVITVLGVAYFIELVGLIFLLRAWDDQRTKEDKWKSRIATLALYHNDNKRLDANKVQYNDAIDLYNLLYTSYPDSLLFAPDKDSSKNIYLITRALLKKNVSLYCSNLNERRDNVLEMMGSDLDTDISDYYDSCKLQVKRIDSMLRRYESKYELMDSLIIWYNKMLEKGDSLLRQDELDARTAEQHVFQLKRQSSRSYYSKYLIGAILLLFSFVLKHIDDYNTKKIGDEKTIWKRLWSRKTKKVKDSN